MANSILAAILSFFVPGLGQFYDGHFLRGVGVFALFCFFTGVSAATLELLFFVPFIFWLWNIYDAYSLAR